MGNYSVVVLDFETTGLSPEYGDRAIEIGAVLIRDNRIVDRFQSLMNPGRRISRFIEGYTGITNTMLETAPPGAEVMERFVSFMGDHPLVAHNASFDRRFLDGELGRINRKRRGEFGCSMLLARRLYPDAPGHRLEALVTYKKIATSGVYHRALADAEMTGHLWLRMTDDLKKIHGVGRVTFPLMQQLSKVSKNGVVALLQKVAAPTR